MTAKFQRDGLNLTRQVLDHIRATCVDETPAQAEIRDATSARPEARMMIPPEQGQLLRVLLRPLRPKRVVEVGVFTGYSATWLVDALAPGGELVACDLSAEYLQAAQQGWERAGISDRITPRQGPGAASLQALRDEGWDGTVDAIFVDADKTGYDTYYTLGLELLRPGGVMLFDNILWGGAVARPEADDPNTRALRALPARAHADDRVDAAILTDGDGLLMIVKR